MDLEGHDAIQPAVKANQFIHFPNGQAQQYLLVRLPPKEEKPAGG